MVGKHLLLLRKDHHLTQAELAAILNVNKHSISAYERDKSEPPDSIKIAIAKYFNVSVDFLLGLTKRPIPLEQRGTLVHFPRSFPEEMLPELYSYAEYLVYKANNGKPQKTNAAEGR